MRQLILVLFVAACARPYVAPAVTPPALGTSHVTGTEGITPPNQDAEGRATTKPASPEATQLLVATVDLEHGMEPERLARALQALATAIDVP